MDVTVPIAVPVEAAKTFACVYRILTERKNISEVENWLASQGIDYLIFLGKGAWHEARENSMAIELAAATKDEAVSTALSVKESNEQQEIIVQELPVVSMFF
jgi:hypothetical protein